VNRRSALVALWAIFAAAAVGVGFGAAGLVGDPFTAGTTSGAGPAVDGTATSEGSSSPATPTASPSRQPSTGGPSTTAGPAGGPETRSLSTRGGIVSATCGTGQLQLSASPAVGWEIHDLESGDGGEGKVRFERSEDGEGRVDVRASCDNGVPRFAIEDDSHGHGGEDGSDDGGDD
jgi:hypothetical protein